MKAKTWYTGSPEVKVTDIACSLDTVLPSRNCLGLVVRMVAGWTSKEFSPNVLGC